jgi:hypothetical protein
VSGVPESSTLGSHLSSIFISDLCAKIRFSEFLFFVDDLKIFPVTKSDSDCKLLQSDIFSV